MTVLQSDMVDRRHMFLLEKAGVVFLRQKKISTETISLLVVMRKIFLSVSAQRANNYHIVATVGKIGIPELFGRVVHTSVNTQLIIMFRGKKQLSVIIDIVKLGQ